MEVRVSVAVSLDEAYAPMWIAPPKAAPLLLELAEQCRMLQSLMWTVAVRAYDLIQRAPPSAVSASDVATA